MERQNKISFNKVSLKPVILDGIDNKRTSRSLEKPQGSPELQIVGDNQYTKFTNKDLIGLEKMRFHTKSPEQIQR